MKLPIITLTSLLATFRLVQSQEELDCKPRPGCHIAKCDPAPLPFPAILHRSEYPIICVRNSAEENEVTLEDYQALMTLFRNALNDLAALKAELNDLKTKCEADSAQERSQLDSLREDLREEVQKLTELQKSDAARMNKMHEDYKRLLKEMQRFNLDRSVDLLKLIQLEKAVARLQAESTATTAGYPMFGRSGVFPTVPASRSTAAAETTATGNPEHLRTLRCNFDTTGDLCGLRNSVNDDFDWNWHSGKTPSPSTGPNKDRTKRKRDGGYIYIDGSSPRKVNDVAILETPYFTPGGYCVRFSVHMSGVDMGDVQIKLVEFHDGMNRTRPLWYRYGDHGSSWEDSHVYFETSPETEYLKLEFRGWRGEGPASDVALDDVIIKRGKCKDDT